MEKQNHEATCIKQLVELCHCHNVHGTDLEYSNMPAKQNS